MLWNPSRALVNWFTFFVLMECRAEMDLTDYCCRKCNNAGLWITSSTRIVYYILLYGEGVCIRDANVTQIPRMPCEVIWTCVKRCQPVDPPRQHWKLTSGWKDTVSRENGKPVNEPLGLPFFPLFFSLPFLVVLLISDQRNWTRT